MDGTPIDTFDLTNRFAAILRRRFGYGCVGAKRLADHLRINEKTARNLIEGNNAPNAANLVRMLTEIDEIFDEVCQMTGRADVADIDQMKRDLADIETVLRRARTGE